MELNGAQTRFLRGLGQRLKPLAHLGKLGLSGEGVENIRRLFETRELLKVRLPEGPQRFDDAAAMAQATGSALVQVLGRTALLYRPNERLAPDRRISLP